MAVITSIWNEVVIAIFILEGWIKVSSVFSLKILNPTLSTSKLDPSTDVCQYTEHLPKLAAWKAEGVIVILEKAVLFVVEKEILPHALLLTDVAFDHQEMAELGLDIIDTTLELAPIVLVGAGDVCEH